MPSRSRYTKAQLDAVEKDLAAEAQRRYGKRPQDGGWTAETREVWKQRHRRWRDETNQRQLRLGD